MLRQLFLDFLRQNPDFDPQKLEQPDALMKDLGLDSLGMVEMLFEIEDKYGFQLENPMRYNEMTIDQVVADIEASIRAKHNGEMPDIAQK